MSQSFQPRDPIVVYTQEIVEHVVLCTPSAPFLAGAVLSPDCQLVSNTITSISPATEISGITISGAPTQITTLQPHNLVTGANVTIAGATTSPDSINGTWVATVVTATEFTILANVTSASAYGTLVANNITVNVKDEIKNIRAVYLVDNVDGSIQVINKANQVVNGDTVALTYTPTIPSPGLPNQLATANTYGILASTSATTVGSTHVQGDFGQDPGSTVTGAFTVSGATNLANPAALQAQNDALATFSAFLTLGMAGTVIPNALDGQNLTPGNYTFGAGDVNLATTIDGTLTFTGSSTDRWIIYTPSTLTTGAGGIPTMTFVGTATGANVFWIVGSSATINSGVTSSGATFAGTILADTSISVSQLAIIDGRLITISGASGAAITFAVSAEIDVPTSGSTTTFTPDTVMLYFEYTK